MSSRTPARVSAGVPDGGQFAHQHKPEASVSLSALTHAERAASDAMRAALDESYARGHGEGFKTGFDQGHEQGYKTAAAELDAHIRKMTGDRTVGDLLAELEKGRSRAVETPASIYVEGRGEGVVVPGWGTFHQTGPDVDPYDITAMRFEANRDLDDAEIAQLADLIGYKYKADLRNFDGVGLPERDSARSFVISADPAESRSDDLGAALTRFEDGLDEFVRDGSPVRKSDRAGAGTKGTRLVNGLYDNTLTLTPFYNDRDPNH